ncbi:MAG: hypothetical protein K9L56_15505 [Clostridiales bacterium]|nr:hypothetical protein [Clostridiales bacterium]
MNRVVLAKTKLKNFKGLTFTINLANSHKIYGDNETGKSTLSDAHHWLFTGKNRFGTTKFEPKPLDENNEAIHQVEVSVEETFLVDGSEVVLERIWRENWDTVRGSVNEKLQGHSTEFVINGVPDKTQTEFKEYVRMNIIDLDVKLIPMLTNPFHFNSLGQQEMREKLLDLEDISDQEVLEQNNYDGVDEKLEQFGSGYKDILQKEMRGINKDLKSIPDRIDELNSTLKEEPKKPLGYYKEKVLDIENKIDELKKSQGSNIDNEKIADLRRKKGDLEADIHKIKAEHRDTIQDTINVLQGNINELSDYRAEIKNDIVDVKNEIRVLKGSVADKEDRLEGLRGEFAEVSETEDSKVLDCPQCGFPIKKHHIEGEDNYNQMKAEKLKEINREGKKISGELKKDRKELSKFEDKLEDLEKEKKELEAEIQEKSKKSGRLQKDLKEKKYKEDEDYIELKNKVEKIEAEIEKVKKGDSSEDSYDEEISELKREKEPYEKAIRNIGFNKDIKKKIQARKKELISLKNKYEKKEADLERVERFIRDKAFLLQKKVNDRFEIVRFKLFKEYLNGSIKPTCKCLVNGVPYEGNLNTGNKINGGLDIINTFQKFYGARLPVFVDNAEGVTDLNEINTQIIKLIKPTIDTEEEREYYSELKQRRIS